MKKLFIYNENMNELVIALLILSGVVFAFLIVRFFRYLLKYQYRGNFFIYTAFCYVLCLCYSLYANFYPAIAPQTTSQPFVIVVTSFFDALKMMVAAFDRSTIAQYFFANDPMKLAFGIGYLVTSIGSLAFGSLSVLIATVRNFKMKIKAFFKKLKPSTELYYIFCDSGMPMAAKLAQELNGKDSKNKVVVMYVTRSSQKTQEGTEYKDFLVSKGLDVRTENFSKGLASLILRHFDKKFWLIPFCFKKRKIFVYGLFSNDDTSVEVGSHFLSALSENKGFKKLYEKLKSKETLTDKEMTIFESFKVFLTYHDSDIDKANGFSRKTGHIISTLSLYDMISSEFLLNNQLSNFVDLSSIKDDEDNKSLNVTFLGFGKVNRSIFDKMKAAYQLWTDNTNKVNYHVLDQFSESLAALYKNHYTEPSKDKFAPYFYNITGELDGKDLTSEEEINRYLENIKNDSKSNRFSEKGFEMFLVSFADTNTDIRVSMVLRNSLIKYFGEERLKRTIIFVRIADDKISRNFEDKEFNEFVLTQEEVNAGALLKDHVSVPIVVYGQNSLMSSYLSNHAFMINKLGLAAMISYYGGDSQRNFTTAKFYLGDKDSITANTDTVYSLKTKLNLFGYDLTPKYLIKRLDGKETSPKEFYEDISEKIAAVEYPELPMDNAVRKLAALEHNRWLVTSYKVFKYLPLGYEEFLEISKKKGKATTKNESEDKNICMVTNAGLKAFRNKALEDLGEGSKERLDKICFKYDVDALKTVFHTLVEFQEKGR